VSSLWQAAPRTRLHALATSLLARRRRWNPWYAPVGSSLANGWRIGTDDYDWEHALQDIDTNAPLWPYAGPGGFNNPCLLLGRGNNGQVYVTDQQGRCQFTMWAIMASPLILSQNVRNLTAMQLATYR